MSGPQPGPRILVNTRGRLADAERDGLAGAVWRIAEAPRDLDANVIRLPAGDRIDAPDGADLDVLVLVLDGGGDLHNATGSQAITTGDVCWLPAHAGRSIVAGAAGLAYLSVHRRRPPRGISPASREHP
jgi:hypothetical protein